MATTKKALDSVKKLAKRMAKRHLGKHQPTYKSLKAQGKVMSQAGEEITLKKGIPGRGGGLQGVSGDRHVWGRFEPGTGDRTKNRKKVSAKKTAKRRGTEKKQVVDTDYLYGDWMKNKKMDFSKPVPDRKGKKMKREHPVIDRKKITKTKRVHPIGSMKKRKEKTSGELM